MTTTAAELRANAQGARASMNTALAEIFDNCAETLNQTQEMYYMILTAANEEGVRATKAEAALERARALLAELAACGYECQAGSIENNQVYRDLAALLASGGAA